MPEYSILTKKLKNQQVAFCRAELALHKLFKQGDFNMSENAEVKEVKEVKEARKVVYAAEPKVNSHIETLIGFGRGAKTVYEIQWDIPKTEEEAIKRYNCTLEDLVVLGVRNLTTKPDYQSVGFDKAGNLIDKGHELMQNLADSYKVGAKKTSTKTAEQRQLESVLAAKNMTMAELIEKAKNL